MKVLKSIIVLPFFFLTLNAVAQQAHRPKVQCCKERKTHIQKSEPKHMETKRGHLKKREELRQTREVRVQTK